MTTHGQFCSIARALDVLGQRWMLLVVRELLTGSRRFGEIRRGLPRISRTMLSARLHELVDTGIARRGEDGDGPFYELTPAGRELEGTLRELGVWGQRWLSRELTADLLDTEALVSDMRRRIDREALPRSPLVARIETWVEPRRREERYLLLRRSEVSLCGANAGFPVELHVRAPLRTLTAWWRGDVTLSEARASGLTLEGRREWVRAFPRWFERYLFAGVRPARRE
jgi:DNA-binding HxlR family transcriptional regulator